MRRLWRTTDRGLLRDLAAIAGAAGVIGLSYGAIATTAGVPAWAVVAMSLVVFAGGSQFLAVGTLAAGNPVAAVLGGLLVNARHLPFGLAVTGDVGRGGWRRAVGAHLLIDESVAFALARTDPAQRRRAYWLTGVSLFVVWNTGTVLGVVVGQAVGDPARFGLDAAFPAGLLALILPRLRDPATARVVAVGSAVAVATSFVLPAGLPVLLALTGLVVAGRASATVESRA
jgi:4-azaleucine resistance transporter AzlC